MSELGLLATATPVERAAVLAAERRQRLSDRSQLRRSGVVPTPLALVHFALARLERALVQELGLERGLASPELVVLDPAVGTGIWLSSLLASVSGRGAPRALLGFDTDRAALQTAERLLAPAARAAGVTLALRQENTLAVPDPWPAGDAVRVVLGNPPWGARSLSRGLSLNDLWLREFHHDANGEALNERRRGVLSDDYVRFFRWGLQQAREAPGGAALCFVTNASFLEGPVHRGMRAALVGSFDSIEVVDLGGSALRSRGEASDEGLFPVRVGAALTLCVRKPGRARQARIAYARLWGKRAEKLAALQQSTHAVSVFAAEAPWYRLVAQPAAPAADAGFALPEAFPFHGEGVQTNRDAVATAHDAASLRARLVLIARGELTVPESAHFELATARRRIAHALESSLAPIAQLAYRPFEARVYCTLAPLCHRPRPLLARAVAASELCLLSTRQEPGAADWNMFALVTDIADSSYLSVRSSCRTRVFPSHGPDGSPNIAAATLERIAERVGRAPTARELLCYCAGVLGSPLFRRLHRSALKLDYPRLPWPEDATAFGARVAAGQGFLRILSSLARGTARFDNGAHASEPTLSLESELPLTSTLDRRSLRWLSPHQLELAPGTRIGASVERSFRAQVGHHALVEGAYRSGGTATIARVLEACERATMWVQAERAADAAYRPASCVGDDAKAIAVAD